MLRLFGILALVVFGICLIPVVLGFIAVAGPLVLGIFAVLFPLLARGAAIGYTIGKKK